MISASGGSIYLVTGTLAGDGSIRANGGDQGTFLGADAYGGGGRVAIYYEDKSGFRGGVQARGGVRINSNGTLVPDTTGGGAGTVYWKKISNALGELMIDNGGVKADSDWSTPLLPQGILRLNSWTISGNARVSTSDGVRVANGSSSYFSGLISSNYLQVGGLLVSNTWVFGDVIDVSASASNKVVIVTVFCRPQKTYLLLASTDLMSWSAIATFTPSGSRFDFADTNAPAFNRRFFRVIMQDYLFDALGISVNRTNRQAQLKVNGAQPNHTLLLQASDDLRSWTGLGSVSTTTVTNWQFLDTNAPSFNKRFYRAVGQGK